jgi:hypothetical protein
MKKSIKILTILFMFNIEVSNIVNYQEIPEKIWHLKNK